MDDEDTAAATPAPSDEVEKGIAKSEGRISST